MVRPHCIDLFNEEGKTNIFSVFNLLSTGHSQSRKNFPLPLFGRLVGAPQYICLSLFEFQYIVSCGVYCCVSVLFCQIKFLN